MPNDVLKFGRDFFAATDEASVKESPAMRHEAPPPAQEPLPPNAELISLKEPELLPDRPVNFLELIETRETLRQYGSSSLSLDELSYLLWTTQGLKQPLPQEAGKRTVPSAGGRHPLDTYIYAQKIEGLAAGGLYKFLPYEHKLLPVNDFSAEKFLSGFGKRAMIEKGAALFMWVAVARRTIYRFGARGWRYIFLDAGHVCQNLYLAAQTIGSGACAIGSFEDDIVNGALPLGADEYAVYGAVVGKI